MRFVFCKYFLLGGSLSSHPLHSVSQSISFFILMKPSLSVLLFMDHVFCYLESYHQGHLSFLLSYKSFIVYILHLHLFYFELIFVVDLRSVSRLIVFACGCPVVPAPFVGRDCLCYIVSPLFLCQRSTDCINVGLFLDSLFIPLFIYLSYYFTNTTLSWLLYF